MTCNSNLSVQAKFLESTSATAARETKVAAVAAARCSKVDSSSKPYIN